MIPNIHSHESNQSDNFRIPQLRKNNPVGMINNPRRQLLGQVHLKKQQLLNRITSNNSRNNDHSHSSYLEYLLHQINPKQQQQIDEKYIKDIEQQNEQISEENSQINNQPQVSNVKKEDDVEVKPYNQLSPDNQTSLKDNHKQQIKYFQILPLPPVKQHKRNHSSLHAESKKLKRKVDNKRSKTINSEQKIRRNYKIRAKHARLSNLIEPVALCQRERSLCSMKNVTNIQSHPIHQQLNKLQKLLKQLPERPEKRPKKQLNSICKYLQNSNDFFAGISRILSLCFLKIGMYYKYAPSHLIYRFKEHRSSMFIVLEGVVSLSNPVLKFKKLGFTGEIFGEEMYFTSDGAMESLKAVTKSLILQLKTTDLHIIRRESRKLDYYDHFEAFMTRVQSAYAKKNTLRTNKFLNSYNPINSEQIEAKSSRQSQWLEH